MVHPIKQTAPGLNPQTHHQTTHWSLFCFFVKLEDGVSTVNINNIEPYWLNNKMFFFYSGFSGSPCWQAKRPWTEQIYLASHQYCFNLESNGGDFWQRARNKNMCTSVTLIMLLKKGCVSFFHFLHKKLHTYPDAHKADCQSSWWRRMMKQSLKVTETLDGRVNTQSDSVLKWKSFSSHTLGKRPDTTLRRGEGTVSAQLQPTVTDVPPNNHFQPSQCQLQLP